MSRSSKLREANLKIQEKSQPSRTTQTQPEGDAMAREAKSREQDLKRIREYIGKLKDPDWNVIWKGDAALKLAELCSSDAGRRAIEAEGGLPPLIQLLQTAHATPNSYAACALCGLAEDAQIAQAIVDCGGRGPLEAMANYSGEDYFWEGAAENARQALKHLPKDAPDVSGGSGSALSSEVKALDTSSKEEQSKAAEAPCGSAPKRVKAEVKALESGNSDEQCKAAEQLGSWASTSDENRSAIIQAGGAEALVALVVNGTEDAKWHAARAIRNLANHAEAKASILKADGIAVLTPFAKHGKGKLKEAASEALSLLSVAEAVADAKPLVEPVPTPIPTGEGTRVAMFSARFDGGPVEQKFRKVFSILREHKYDVLMVAADAGQSFGDLTTEYLGRLQKERGTMLAVCTRHYGEMTASAYSSHKELKFALDYENDVKVLPLKVEDTYPPQPPGGPEHKYDKKCLAQGYILSIFKPSVVYLDCQGKSEADIAADIAKELQKLKAASRVSD